MTVYTPLQIRNYKASADGDAFLGVTLGTADGSCKIVAASTDYPLGFLTEVGMDSGNRADVIVAGDAVGVAGAAVTKGAKVMFNTAGKVIAHTGSNAAIGYAETAASAADKLLNVTIDRS